MTDAALLDRIATTEAFPAEGRILRLSASEIVADGPDLSIGVQCVVFAKGLEPVRAQVVSVGRDQVTLVPFGAVDGLRVGDVVRAVAGTTGLPVGDGFAARAIDALGRSIDGGPPIRATAAATRMAGILDRLSPDRPLQTGISSSRAVCTNRVAIVRSMSRSAHETALTVSSSRVKPNTPRFRRCATGLLDWHAREVAMRDAAELRKMAAIVRLREAQGEAARSALLAESDALRQHEDIEWQHRDARDAGLRAWTERLAASTFDPILERLGGAWLLEQERQLEASHLDTAIIRARQAQAAETLSVARARMEASREIRIRLSKALTKDREERQSGEIADMFLHRKRG